MQYDLTSSCFDYISDSTITLVMPLFSTMEEIDDFGFEHPRNTIISGPTSSGKSYIMGNILSHAKSLFTPGPSKRILFYREDQPIYNFWIQQGILDEKCEGMPDRVDFLAQLAEHRDNGGCLVFFDDFSSLIEQHKTDFIYYFTIASHHYNASMFLIIHSLFSPALRLLSLNTHRFILTKSPRDIGQVRTLASQAFPGRTAFVIDAFEDSTEKKYGFLILDFSPNCDTRLRCMSNIFGPGLEKTVFQYKPLVKTAFNKMEKNYRKQALIPWLEYQRLKAKASACNAVERPDGQNMSNQAKIFIHHDSHSTPYYHGSVPPTSSNTDSWQHHSRQSEEVKEGVGTEAGVLSKTPTVPNLTVEAKLKPSSVASEDLSLGRGAIPKTVKKMKTKLKKTAVPVPPLPLPESFNYPPTSSQVTPMSYDSPPIPTHNSGPPLPLPLHAPITLPLTDSIANNSSEPMYLGQTLGTSLQSAPISALSSSGDTPSLQYDPSVQSLKPIDRPTILPVQALPNASRLAISSLPSSNAGMAIDHSPTTNASISQHTGLPLEYRTPYDTIPQREPLVLEYRPDTTTSNNGGLRRLKNMNMEEGGSKTRKKIPQGPLRAIENMTSLPLDRSYPSSHIRDQDIEPSPAAFSTKRVARKKRPTRPLVRGSIFRPSPPISDTGRKGVNSLRKRKNTHLSKPRPSAPKISKVNRGDKRKPDTQGSRGLKKKLLKETEYDLW